MKVNNSHNNKLNLLLFTLFFVTINYFTATNCLNKNSINNNSEINSEGTQLEDSQLEDSQLEDSQLTFQDLLENKKIPIIEFIKTADKFLSKFNKKQTEFTAEKCIISPDSKVVILTDVHGNKEAITNIINDLYEKKCLDENNKFKINKPNFYIIFLGDLVGRGKNSIETLYIVMRLKIENTNKVFYLKGNHEDPMVNMIDGFYDEILSYFKKASSDNSDYNIKVNCCYLSILYNLIQQNKIHPESQINIITQKIAQIYNVLPYVLYLGVKNEKSFVNYVMLAHGSIEPRFNPNKLLESKESKVFTKASEIETEWLDIDLKKALADEMPFEYFEKQSLTNNSLTTNNGFLWGDFSTFSDSEIDQSNRNILVANFGETPTKQYLKSCSKKDSYAVNAIIRGHQHNDVMIGYKMIDNYGLYGIYGDSDKQIEQWNGKEEKTIPIPKNTVWTILAAPSEKRKKTDNHNFYSYTVLKTDKEFENWKLCPVKLK